MAPPLPVYDVHAAPRPARLLVVSNTKVRTRPDRKFSARDGAMIVKTLQDILHIEGKDRQFLVNKTKAEILQTFEEESSNKDLKDYGMLIVVLLSYGYTGHIYGSDNRPVIVDDLMEYFRGSNCIAMVGKPKIFIVQACEGDMYQKVSPVVDDSGIQKQEGTKCCIPSEADFLIMWSPIPGNVGWHEDEKQCSPFVDALVKSLDEFKGMEIARLMTRITQKVCEELEKHADKEFRKAGCCLPYMVHMLTKELYFHTLTAGTDK